MPDNHRSVEILLKELSQPGAFIRFQPERQIKLDRDFGGNFKSRPRGELGDLLTLARDSVAQRGCDPDVIAQTRPSIGWKRPVDRTNPANPADVTDVIFLKYIMDMWHVGIPHHRQRERLI